VERLCTLVVVVERAYVDLGRSFAVAALTAVVVADKRQVAGLWSARLVTRNGGWRAAREEEVEKRDTVREVDLIVAVHVDRGGRSGCGSSDPRKRKSRTRIESVMSRRPDPSTPPRRKSSAKESDVMTRTVERARRSDRVFSMGAS